MAYTAFAEKPMIRMTTAGSVDDGKSTLIGRLLYECGGIFEDQRAHLERIAQERGEQEIDFSLVTDGLLAEREQGITIDVAYRYFSIKGRRYMIADVPGHEQYLRNMVTGASNADVMIILIDAQKGVTVQTRRHLFIASLLRISHVCIVVNKMDLVSYDEHVFHQCVQDVQACVRSCSIEHVFYIPTAAKCGEMVTTKRGAMPWYAGPTLLEYLVALHPSRSIGAALRLPVQLVSRAHDGMRWYSGTLESGNICVGDTVAIWPSGAETTVAELLVHGSPCKEAHVRDAVSLRVCTNIDASRGDCFSSVRDPVKVTSAFLADMCWMSDIPWSADGTYVLKHTTKTTRVRHLNIKGIYDMNAVPQKNASAVCARNDIVHVAINVVDKLCVEPFTSCKEMGNFILIDEKTGETCAAGIIVAPNTKSESEEQRMSLLLCGRDQETQNALHIVCDQLGIPYKIANKGVVVKVSYLPVLMEGIYAQMSSAQIFVARDQL